jgi:hypothetical protein
MLLVSQEMIMKTSLYNMFNDIKQIQKVMVNNDNTIYATEHQVSKIYIFDYDEKISKS